MHINATPFGWYTDVQVTFDISSRSIIAGLTDITLRKLTMGYTRAVIRARHLLMTAPTAPEPPTGEQTNPHPLPAPANPPPVTPLRAQPTHAPMARR